MKITILCVGKIKEKYFSDAIAEYAKRLSRYCKLEIVEVADEKTPDRASEKEEQQIRRIEGERILRHIPEDDQVFALCIEGKQLTTEKLRKTIKLDMDAGRTSFTFIIGGSLGLAPEVVQRAKYKISFSSMTFPHQMMRMILLEQLDRVI